jgi:hypothetical protein
MHSLSIERSNKFKFFEDKKVNASNNSYDSKNASLERNSQNRNSKVFTSHISKKECEVLPGPGKIFYFNIIKKDF